MPKKNTIFTACLIVLMLLMVEGVSFFVAGQLTEKGIFYSRKSLQVSNESLENEDPLLGWPTEAILANGSRDITGSRNNPLYSAAQKSCLSVYGESYALSSPVDDDNAWTTLLSGKLKCRVSNFAAGAYGSDQSYIRFQNNNDDRSPLVFLFHLSNNILRNTNQFRPLLFSQATAGLKPRYVINQRNELEFIPRPALSDGEFVELLNDPAVKLEHEYFLPEGPSGVRFRQFPYTYSLISSLKHFAMQAWLKGQPKHMDFYQKDHPAGGLEVTAQILNSFARDAKQQQRKPVVVLLPTLEDILYWRQHAVWPYAALTERLDELNIDYIDAGPPIDRLIADNEPRMYWKNAHPNIEGYKVLAQVMYEVISEKQLLGALKETEKPDNSV